MAEIVSGPDARFNQIWTLATAPSAKVVENTPSRSIYESVIPGADTRANALVTAIEGHPPRGSLNPRSRTLTVQAHGLKLSLTEMQTVFEPSKPQTMQALTLMERIIKPS